MHPADRRPRTIDRIRDGGGRGEVPPAFGGIVAMVTTEHRIYFIAERGVTSGVMADQIDPERKNPGIPMLVQREELTYGATTPFIQRTFGAAAELLNPTHLPEGFPTERALLIALAAAQDLAAVADIVADLNGQEVAVRARMERGEVKLAHLPRTPSLQGRSEQAIAHLRTVQLGLVELAGIFYPKLSAKAPWAESVRRGLSADDPFNQLFDDAVDTLAAIANYRHALIHPKPHQSVQITDYDLGADGIVIAPTIEVSHPEAPLSRRDIVQFLDVQIGVLADIFESFLGVFCDRSPRPYNDAFEAHVVQLPDGGLTNASRLYWEISLLPGVQLVPPPAT